MSLLCCKLFSERIASFLPFQHPHSIDTHVDRSVENKHLFLACITFTQSIYKQAESCITYTNTLDSRGKLTQDFCLKRKNYDDNVCGTIFSTIYRASYIFQEINEANERA